MAKVAYNIIHNPEVGTKIQYLGIYALQWPWDSGVNPTVGFCENFDEQDEIEDLTKLCKEQIELLEKVIETMGLEYAFCRVTVDGIATMPIVGIAELRNEIQEAIKKAEEYFE